MKRNGNKGITLIALVVTIIVLLILAGIVIMALTGENGILNQAINANKQTDIAGTKEQIKLELVGRYDDEGDYTNDDVIEAVKTVTGQTVEEGAATVTTAKGNEVDISDLWKEIYKGIYNYQINTNGGVFLTLDEAVENAKDGDTINVLKDVEDTSTVTINKDITLNTQSYTITRSATITVSSGYTLTVSGTGTITSSGNIHTITNDGTLKKTTSATISATGNTAAIRNNRFSNDE